LCNDYAFSAKREPTAGLYGYYNTITEAQLAVIYPEQIQFFKPKTSSLAQQYLSPHQYAVTVLKPC